MQPHELCKSDGFAQVEERPCSAGLLVLVVDVKEEGGAEAVEIGGTLVQRPPEPLAFGLEALGRDVVVDACIGRPVELQLGHGRCADGDGEGLGFDIVGVALQGGNDVLDCDDGPHGKEAEAVNAETEDEGFDRDVLSEAWDVIVSVCRRGCLWMCIGEWPLRCRYW